MDCHSVSHGRFDRFRSERGIGLIHVALLLFVLMGLSMFVTDYGVVWLARVQAQNAADSGAIAGATARAYDELADPPASNGAAQQSAMGAATSHSVLGAAPTAQVLWTCPAFVPAANRCVRVDVFRDGTNGSTTLPSYFGAVFGITSQRVRATATAWAVTANTTNCMRPWAVADKWTEVVAPAAEYNHWDRMGNTVIELMPHDSYTRPPIQGEPGYPGYGTGFRVSPPAPGPGDQGTEVILKVGSSGQGITPGWFLPLDLPGAAGGYPTGANVYRANIGTCVGTPVSLRDRIPTETGNMVGPTQQGFDDLVALDPTADWNTTTNEVTGSCAPTCAAFSPRIVPITVFDIDDYQHRLAANDWSGCPGGGKCVTVVNILGFFVDRMQGNDVVGYLCMYPGEFVQGRPNIGNAAGFATEVVLIQ